MVAFSPLWNDSFSRYSLLFVSVVVVVAFGDALGLVAISVFGQNAERDTHTHTQRE